MREKQYPTHPDGELDKGDKRTEPCPRRTWCVLPHGHTGNCPELPRYDLNRSEPKRGAR